MFNICGNLIQQQSRKQAQEDGQWILVFVRKFSNKRKNNEKASRYKISDQSTRPHEYIRSSFFVTDGYHAIHRIIFLFISYLF